VRGIVNRTIADGRAKTVDDVLNDPGMRATIIRLFPQTKAVFDRLNRPDTVVDPRGATDASDRVNSWPGPLPAAAPTRLADGPSPGSAPLWSSLRRYTDPVMSTGPAPFTPREAAPAPGSAPLWSSLIRYAEPATSGGTVPVAPRAAEPRPGSAPLWSSLRRYGEAGTEAAADDNAAVDDRLAELRQISRETPHLFTRAMEAEQIKLLEAKMARKPVWG
jgi:hypothetical protein